MKEKAKRGMEWIKAHSKLIGMKDKALIILLIILMGQSTYVLFAGDPISTNAASIDLVVRTTSAAIFGYFLSANFLSKDATSDKCCNVKGNKQSQVEEINENTQMRIMSRVENDTQNKTKTKIIREASNHCKAQIAIATIIAIYALMVLIIARDAENVSSIATLSQFRDFVSGCVGFLVGTPINRGNK